MVYRAVQQQAPVGHADEHDAQRVLLHERPFDQADERSKAIGSCADGLFPTDAPHVGQKRERVLQEPVGVVRETDVRVAVLHERRTFRIAAHAHAQNERRVAVQILHEKGYIFQRGWRQTHASS
jgi:hypothetical protein